MLKNIQPSHTHSEKCTEGCTADISIPKKTISNDTIVSYVKDKNACQHNIISLLKNKQNDEDELKRFFNGFEPPPPPCDSQTKKNLFTFKDDFLGNIQKATSLSALAKLIVDAKIDCQAELFIINDKEHNKLNLWSNIKNMATKISQTMIIPTVEKQALPGLNDLSSLIKKQKSLEDLKTKLNDYKIKHSDIKDILTTDMLPTIDTSGKINLTEGLPKTEKKELEKKITEYKNNTEPKKDTGLFMAILECFENIINKLLGRVGILEEEMEKQKKNTNDNKTELEKQQKKLTDLETKINTVPAGPKGEDGAQGEAGKDGKDGVQGVQGVKGEKGQDATNLSISQDELDKRYVKKEDFKNHTTQYQNDQDAIKIGLDELADDQKQLEILKEYFSDSNTITEIFNNETFKKIFNDNKTDNSVIKNLEARIVFLEKKTPVVPATTATNSPSPAEPYIKDETEFIAALVKVLNKNTDKDSEIADALKKIFITKKDFEAIQATHNEQITQLETEYNTKVEKLHTQYTQLKTKIDAIDTNLKDIVTKTDFSNDKKIQDDNKIIALEKAKDVLKQEIIAIQTALKTKDATNDNAIAELNNRIKIIEDQLTKERTQLVTNTKLYEKISYFETEKQELIERIEKITTEHKIIKQNIDTSKYALNEEFKKDQARQDEEIKSMQNKLNEKISSIPVKHKETIPVREQTISLKDPNGKVSKQYKHKVIDNPPPEKTDGRFTYLTYWNPLDKQSGIGKKFTTNIATIHEIENARGKITLRGKN